MLVVGSGVPAWVVVDHRFLAGSASCRSGLWVAPEPLSFIVSGLERLGLKP